MQTISNGALLGGPEPAEPGWQRWRWQHSEPMATYLAFVAIGHYDILRRDTPFGPYPFPQLGGVVPDTPTLRGSLEAQTRPVNSQSRVAQREVHEQQGVVAARGGSLVGQARDVEHLELGGGPQVVVARAQCVAEVVDRPRVEERVSALG
jgi:hypothetical protein